MGSQGMVEHQVHRLLNDYTRKQGMDEASPIIPTKGGGDPEMILHHHMSAGYTGPDVWAAIAFGGWTFITEDIGGVGERTINEIGASVGIARGPVRPALHVIAPLDDGYNSQVGIVIGLGVSVTMK